MTKKYNVETEAIINRNPIGSIITLPEKEAKHLESIGYVRIINEVKPKPKTAKKTTTKSTAKKDAKKKAESKK